MNLWKIFGDRVKGSSIPKADEVAKNTARVRKLAQQARQARAGADRVTELPDGKTATTLGGPLKRAEDVDGPVPSWLGEDQDRLVGQAVALGVKDEIIRLAKSKTAKEIVAAIPQLKAIPDREGESVVRAVRNRAGLDPLDVAVSSRSPQGPKPKFRQTQDLLAEGKEIADAERTAREGTAAARKKASEASGPAAEALRSARSNVEHWKQKFAEAQASGDENAIRAAEGSLRESAEALLDANKQFDRIQSRSAKEQARAQSMLDTNVDSATKSKLVGEQDADYALAEKSRSSRRKEISILRKIRELRGSPFGKRETARIVEARAPAPGGIVKDESPLKPFAAEFKRKIEESLVPKIGENGETYFDTQPAADSAREFVRSLGLRQTTRGKIGKLIDSLREKAEYAGIPTGRQADAPDIPIDKDNLFTTEDFGGTTSYPTDAGEQLDALRRRYGLREGADLSEVVEHIAAERMERFDAASGRRVSTGPLGQPIHRESAELDFKPTLEDDATRTIDVTDEPIVVNERVSPQSRKYLQGPVKQQNRMSQAAELVLKGVRRSPRQGPGDPVHIGTVVDNKGRTVLRETGEGERPNLDPKAKWETLSVDRQRRVAVPPSIPDRLRSLITGRPAEKKYRLETVMAPRTVSRYRLKSGDNDDIVVLRKHGSGDDQNVVHHQIIYRRTPSGNYVKYQNGEEAPLLVKQNGKDKLVKEIKQQGGQWDTQEISEQQLADKLNEGYSVYQQPIGTKLSAPKIHDPEYLASVAKEFYSAVPGAEGANISNVDFVLKSMDDIRRVRGEDAYEDAARAFGDAYGTDDAKRLLQRMRRDVKQMTESGGADGRLVTQPGRTLSPGGTPRPDSPTFTEEPKVSPEEPGGAHVAGALDKKRRSKVADWAQESKDLAKETYTRLRRDGLAKAEAMHLSEEAGHSAEALLTVIHQVGDSPEALAHATRALSDARVAPDPRDASALMAQAAKEASDIFLRDRAALGTAVGKYQDSRKFWSTETGRRASELYQKEVALLDAKLQKGKLTPEEHAEDMRAFHKESIARAIKEFEDKAAAHGGAAPSTVTPESVIQKFYRHGAAPPPDVAAAAVDNFVRRQVAGRIDPSSPELLQFQQNHAREIEEALNYAMSPEGAATIGRNPPPSVNRLDQLMTDDAARTAAMTRIAQINDQAKAFSRANVQLNPTSRRNGPAVGPGQGNVTEPVDFAGNTTLEPQTPLEQKMMAASERSLADAQAKLDAANAEVAAAEKAVRSADQSKAYDQVFNAGFRLEDAKRRRAELEAVVKRAARPDDVRERARIVAEKALKNIEDVTTGPGRQYIPIGQIRQAASKVASRLNVKAPPLFKVLESRTLASRIPSDLTASNKRVQEAQARLDALSGGATWAKDATGEMRLVPAPDTPEKKAARLALRKAEQDYLRAVGGGIESRRVGKSSADVFNDLADNLVDPKRPDQLTLETQQRRFNTMLASKSSGRRIGYKGDVGPGALARDLGDVDPQRMPAGMRQPDSLAAPSSVEDAPHRFVTELAQELGLDPSNQDDVAHLIGSAMHGNSGGRYSHGQVADFAQRANQFLTDAGMFKTSQTGAALKPATRQGTPHMFDALHERLIPDDQIAAMDPQAAAAALAETRRQMDLIKQAKIFGNDGSGGFTVDARTLKLIDEATGRPNHYLGLEVKGPRRAFAPEDFDVILDLLGRQEQQLVRRAPKLRAPEGLTGNPEDQLRDVDAGINKTALAEQAATRAGNATEYPVLLPEHGIRPYVGEGLGELNRQLPDDWNGITVAFTPEQARAMAQAGLQGDVFSARGLHPDSNLNTIPAPAEPGPRISHSVQGEDYVLPGGDKARRRNVTFNIARKYRGDNGLATEPTVSGSGILVENGRVPETHSVIADYDPVTKKFLGFYRLPDTDTIDRSWELAGGLKSEFLGGTELPLGFSANQSTRGIPHIVLPQRRPPRKLGDPTRVDDVTFNHGDIDDMPRGPEVSGGDEDFDVSHGLYDPQRATKQLEEADRQIEAARKLGESGRQGVATPDGNVQEVNPRDQVITEEGLDEAIGNTRPATGGPQPQKKVPPQVGVLGRIGGAVRRNPGRTATGAALGAAMYGASEVAPTAIARSAVMTALGMMRGGEPSLGEDTNIVAVAPVLPRQAAVLNRIRDSRSMPYLTAQNPMPY